MVRDLSVGNPYKLMWLYSLPLIGSVIFQQRYNMADTVIAGRAINDFALAAVGASYPVTMIFMAIALGCNLGCSVIVSRLFGQKHYTEVRESVSTILISVAVLGVVATGIGIGIGSPIMLLLRTPESILADALAYLYIYIGGFLFVLVYNVCTGIYTALGDSMTPFIFLVASSLGNIGLDLLFVLAFDMGVAGLAWATFICQGLAAVLCMLALLMRMRKIGGDRKPKLFSRKLLAGMCAVAIPSVLQQSFISVGNLFIQALVNGHGELVLAGYTAAIKLNTFFLTTLTTVTGAMSSYVAQNLGAQKPERLKQGLLACCSVCAVMIIPFMVFYLAFPETALLLFTQDVEGEAMTTGVQFLHMVVPFYAVVSVKMLFDAVMRGSERMVAFMITTLFDLVIRVVLCFVFDPGMGMGPYGLWLSWPIGWSAATVLSITLCLFVGKRRLIREWRTREGRNA